MMDRPVQAAQYLSKPLPALRFGLGASPLGHSSSAPPAFSLPGAHTSYYKYVVEQGSAVGGQMAPAKPGRLVIPVDYGVKEAKYLGLSRWPKMWSLAESESKGYEVAVLMRSPSCHALPPSLGKILHRRLETRSNVLLVVSTVLRSKGCLLVM